MSSISFLGAAAGHSRPPTCQTEMDNKLPSLVDEIQLGHAKILELMDTFNDACDDLTIGQKLGKALSKIQQPAQEAMLKYSSLVDRMKETANVAKKAVAARESRVSRLVAQLNALKTELANVEKKHQDRFRNREDELRQARAHAERESQACDSLRSRLSAAEFELGRMDTALERKHEETQALREHRNTLDHQLYIAGSVEKSLRQELQTVNESATAEKEILCCKLHEKAKNLELLQAEYANLEQRLLVAEHNEYLAAHIKGANRDDSAKVDDSTSRMRKWMLDHTWELMSFKPVPATLITGNTVPDDDPQPEIRDMGYATGLQLTTNPWTTPSVILDDSETASPSSVTLESHRCSPTSPTSPVSPAFSPTSPGVALPLLHTFSPNSPAYSPTSPGIAPPTISKHWPKSPVYSPESPVYSPESPVYSPESPVWSPESPKWVPESPGFASPFSPTGSRTSPGLTSPTVMETIETGDKKTTFVTTSTTTCIASITGTDHHKPIPTSPRSSPISLGCSPQSPQCSPTSPPSSPCSPGPCIKFSPIAMSSVLAKRKFLSHASMHDDHALDGITRAPSKRRSASQPQKHSRSWDDEPERPFKRRATDSYRPERQA